MTGFLAVSVAPGASGPSDARVRDALTRLCGDPAVAGPAQWHSHDDGWVAFAGAAADEQPSGAGFTVRLGRLLRTRERDLDTSEVPDMLKRGADLSTILPPFAVAHRDGEGGPVLVATDWLGFHQLYHWTDGGVAALSTSARALSALAGGELDPVGLGGQALVGWQLADATPFAGVRTLPPASIATLHRGALRIHRYADPVARPEQPPALDDAVAEMADILVAWQTSYLSAHPDAVLQLTGGHDSRILLGAVPAAQRGGLAALTLGAPDSPDVRIAARLCARYGMRHQVYRFDQLAWPTPAQAHELALAAARALECQASPLALAPLLLAEGELAQGHRLSGLGGEVARGFYYAGQPAGAQTSPRLVERLAQWRLFSNEAVEPAALRADFLDRAREVTLARLTRLLPEGDWLRATDELYLAHRMHRWAGAHGTVAAVRRLAVNPMFDRRFIELALAVAPADKRDSLLLGRLMRRLDADLAGIALDSGLVPARLGTRSAGARVAVASVTARKAVRKVSQRLTRGRRPQLGAASAASLVVAHWRDRPADCAPLLDRPELDPDWLRGLLSGAHDAQPTTVAFLLNLLVAQAG
jgi:asparagine synthase (glutamine-hydrolysing)